MLLLVLFTRLGLNLVRSCILVDSIMKTTLRSFWVSKIWQYFSERSLRSLQYPLEMCNGESRYRRNRCPRRPAYDAYRRNSFRYGTPQRMAGTHSRRAGFPFFIDNRKTMAPKLKRKFLIVIMHTGAWWIQKLRPIRKPKHIKPKQSNVSPT